jgi:cytochrome-b5 reductase
MIGGFQLLIKIYSQGEFSKWLNAVASGSIVQFKHIPFNVKIQYPFGCAKLGIICGGTGITPMLQALHAVLGTEGDTTRVKMLYGSRTTDDIYAKDTLRSWGAQYDRFTVIHALSRCESCDESGVILGHIDSERIVEHIGFPR